MPHDDDNLAVERIVLQLDGVLVDQPLHFALCALSRALRGRIEKSIKTCPLEPHPRVIELLVALGKFGDMALSYGSRARR